MRGRGGVAVEVPIYTRLEEPGFDAVAALEAALSERILVIDGAMGTMLQAYTLDEAGYRGQRFRDGHSVDRARTPPRA